MIRPFSFCHFAVTLGALSVAVLAGAQTPEEATVSSPDNAYFQSATIVGSTNSISITHLPVKAGSKVFYWDLLLPFEVDSYGNVKTGTLDATPSPTLIVSAFKPGTYYGPSTILSGKAKIVLTGPGVWNGVYTQWTISSTSGSDNCTYPDSAAFYNVSALSGNPIYSRLKKAGITSTAWSYGTGSSNCAQVWNWPSNGIIGVSQVGNTLTIASFTNSYYGLVDSSMPDDQITYTLGR